MSINEDVMTEVFSRVYEKAVKKLPDDVKAALTEAYDKEAKPVAKKNLEVILQNIKLAEEKDTVICQDAGVPSFFVRMGPKIEVKGNICKAATEGIRRATLQAPLLPQTVHPISRYNPGTNTGEGAPILYFDICPDIEYLEIMAVPIGGGSEAFSKQKIFSVTHSISAIKRFVIDSVVESGGQPCAPLIVGVGIGGSFDSVGILAKKASVRNLLKRNPDPAIEELESELLTAINKTGIGSMGLGGDTTALAVNIEIGFSHVVLTPVAIKTGCFALRRATARINPDASVVYL